VGTKWTWAKIPGLEFNQNGALKTPWNAGKWGVALKQPKVRVRVRANPNPNPNPNLTLTPTLTLNPNQGSPAVRAAQAVPLGGLRRRGAPPEL